MPIKLYHFFAIMTTELIILSLVRMRAHGYLSTVLKLVLYNALDDNFASVNFTLLLLIACYLIMLL
jgi:hypothetical protein